MNKGLRAIDTLLQHFVHTNDERAGMALSDFYPLEPGEYFKASLYTIRKQSLRKFVGVSVITFTKDGISNTSHMRVKHGAYRPSSESEKILKNAQNVLQSCLELWKENAKDICFESLGYRFLVAKKLNVLSY